MRVLAYLRRNHLALLALLVALSGTAYATTKIGSDEIARNAVLGKHVKNRSLGPGELKRQPRWKAVKPNPPGLPHPDPCPARIGIFCGHASGSSDAWWWKNYGSGWAPAAFYKDSLGTVHLRGLIAVEYLGGLPQAIFRLPAGYRPEDHLVFAANRDRTTFNGGATEVDVRADGIVEWNYDDAERSRRPGSR